MNCSSFAFVRYFVPQKLLIKWVCTEVKSQIRRYVKKYLVTMTCLKILKMGKGSRVRQLQVSAKRELLETCHTVWFLLHSYLCVLAKVLGPCGKGEVLQCIAPHLLWTGQKCHLLGGAKISYSLFSELAVVLHFWFKFTEVLSIQRASENALQLESCRACSLQFIVSEMRCCFDFIKDRQLFRILTFVFPTPLDRAGSISTLDSLDFARYSDDGNRETDERVAGKCSICFRNHRMLILLFNLLSLT